MDSATDNSVTKPRQRSNSFSSAKAGQAQIPLPIQTAFDLTSLSKYTILKNDASFIYKALKICHLCYDSVKAMFAYQSREQLEQRSQKAKSKSLKQQTDSEAAPERTSPMKQGWVQENSKEREDEAGDETVTELDESTNMANSGSAKPTAMMMGFQKVQAGKDVVSPEKPSSRRVTEPDKESAVLSGNDGEVVSLNIKNTTSNNNSMLHLAGPPQMTKTQSEINPISSAANRQSIRSDHHKQPQATVTRKRSQVE